MVYSASQITLHINGHSLISQVRYNLVFFSFFLHRGLEEIQSEERHLEEFGLCHTLMVIRGEFWVDHLPGKLLCKTIHTHVCCCCCVACRHCNSSLYWFPVWWKHPLKVKSSNIWLSSWTHYSQHHELRRLKSFRPPQPLQAARMLS